mgnify:CR=1 FL=1
MTATQTTLIWLNLAGAFAAMLGPITPWPPRRGQITEWSLFRRPGTGWHVGRVVW